MEKVYTIIAGVNGAGKSTFYKMGNILPSDQLRVNSDEILRQNNGDWRNASDQAKAMKETVKRIKDNFERGVSFNQETTLSGRSIINNIIRAKELGYTVNMYYVGLKNADLAVHRVAHRVQTGGHGIDETEIRKRYDSSIKNFKEAIKLCDNVYVYDNTDSFKSIATFSNGKIKSKSDEKYEWFEKLEMQNESNNRLYNHTMDKNSWECAIAQAGPTSLDKQVPQLETERL